MRGEEGCGRWTEGGGSGADTSDGGGLGRLKGNLVANAGPLLEGVRGGARSKMFSQGDILATQHMDGAAKLFHSWSQGADWSDRAFRDHFLSPMHKQDFATGMRQAAQRLAVADNDGDKRSAARDLGWRIGQYGPMEWVKDVPALQKRADAALDPQAPSLGLEGFHSVKQATNFEYAGLKAGVTGKDGPPVFERAAKGMDGRAVVPDLAKRPHLPLVRDALGWGDAIEAKEKEAEDRRQRKKKEREERLQREKKEKQVALVAELEKDLQDPNVQAFLAMVMEAEDGAENRMYGYPEFSDYSKFPVNPKYPNSPTGKYQMTKRTYGEESDETGLTDFSPHTQDLMGVDRLIFREILDAVKQGDLDKALAKAAKEWAALPVDRSGKSNYPQTAKSYDWVVKSFKRHGGHVRGEALKP